MSVFALDVYLNDGSRIDFMKVSYAKKRRAAVPIGL
jgi:hypothetical protein